MSAETLLCFGGPKNGELLAIHRPMDVVLVTRPPDPSQYLMDAVDEPLMLPEPFRYNVEKIGLHDTTKHWGPPGLHDDSCTLVARCLVAPGYPKHRITDAVTALAGFVSIAPFIPWA